MISFHSFYGVSNYFAISHTMITYRYENWKKKIFKVISVNKVVESVFQSWIFTSVGMKPAAIKKEKYIINT